MTGNGLTPTQQWIRGLEDNEQFDYALGTTHGAARIPTLTKQYYGDTMLAGVFEPELADYDRTQPTPYGLHPMFSCWYAYGRTPSGHYWNATRFNQVGMIPRLHLTRTLGSGRPLEEIRETSESFYGYTSNEVTNGAWVQSSLGKPAKRMFLAVEPGVGGRMYDRGLLDLDLTYLGPALQVYHPDPVNSLYMICHVVRAEGTVLGEPFAGMAGYDIAWGAGGVDNRSMPFSTRVEEVWVIGLTEFDDGSYDYYTLNMRRDGNGSGMIYINGVAEPLQGIEGGWAELGADGLPSLVRWSHGGRTWECELKTSSLCSPRNGSYIWQQGPTRLVGDDRRVVRSTTHVETLPRVLPGKGQP